MTYRDLGVVRVFLDVAETVPSGIITVANGIDVFVIVWIVVFPRADAAAAVLVVGDAVVQRDVVVGAGRHCDEEPKTKYRVSHLVADSGWDDSDMGGSTILPVH